MVTSHLAVYMSQWMTSAFCPLPHNLFTYKYMNSFYPKYEFTRRSSSIKSYIWINKAVLLMYCQNSIIEMSSGDPFVNILCENICAPCNPISNALWAKSVPTASGSDFIKSVGTEISRNVTQTFFLNLVSKVLFLACPHVFDRVP